MSLQLKKFIQFSKNINKEIFLRKEGEKENALKRTSAGLRKLTLIEEGWDLY